jgi:glucan 1,3-beta-glucosidase
VWRWAAVALVATVGGIALGLGIEYWLLSARNAAEAAEGVVAIAVAIGLPLAAAAAIARHEAPASFARLLGGRAAPRRLAWWLAALAAVLTVEGLSFALALVFDPRYRGFPASSLIGAAVALAMAALPARTGRRHAAERVAAAALAVSAIVILAQEGLINFEAVGFAAVILILAGTLAGASVGRGRRAAG